MLKRRPEMLGTPEPASLTELADRLAQPAAVITAMRRLDRPTLQVAEAIAALGGETDRSALDRLLGVPDRARPAEVERALAVLREHALLLDEPALVVLDAVRHAWPQPLGLGVPAATALAGNNAEALRVIARNLGVRATGRKAEIFAAVLAALRDPVQVRSMVGAAPAETRELLYEVALTAEEVADHYGYFSVEYGRVSTPVQWALVRGLLTRCGTWGGDLEMPAEAALALRGPDYTAPFEPVAPIPARVAVDPMLVSRDAAAAGAVALRLVTGLLDEIGRTPLALLRSGGVGVRELRRLGKRLGCPAGEIRLGLAVTYQAGLLALSGAEGAPTGEYDGWLRAEPAGRLATLLTAWWSLPAAALVEAEAAWVPADDAESVAGLRAALLAEAAMPNGAGPNGAGPQPGTAVADPSSLVDLVLWRLPQRLPRTGSGRPGVRVLAGSRDAGCPRRGCRQPGRPSAADRRPRRAGGCADRRRQRRAVSTHPDRPDGRGHRHPGRGAGRAARPRR